MRSTKKLLGIFSWGSCGPRPLNQNVEMVGRSNFDRQTPERPSDSQTDLERKIAEISRDLTALYALAGPISRAGDLTGALNDVLLKIIEVTGADAASIRLSDERGDRLILTAHRGFAEDYTKQISIETVRGKIGRQILQTGEAIISEELAEDRRFNRGLLAAHGFRSAAYLPLRASREKILGIMVLASRAPARLNSNQSELFAAIAYQISVALENARLFQEKERRAREQHALRELLANLLLLDLDELLQRITEQAVMLFRADYSRLRLFDEEGKLGTRAVAGDQEIVKQMSGPPERQEPAGRGKWMLDNRRPLAVKDIALYPDHPSRGVKAGLHGFIGAPLFSRDRKPLGVIHVMSRSPRDFSSHDLSLIGQFGNGAAVAIENAGLLKKTEKNLQQLRALREIDQAISSTLDLDKILSVLLEKIELVLPYAAATIRLVNRETGMLEPVACRNLDLEEWKTRQGRGGRDLANAVFEAKAPTIVRDVQTDARVLDTEFYRKNQLVSYLGVPLVVEGEILGVLNFYTKERHEFSSEEVEFLSTLAGQAAVAIRHSQLYEKTRAHEAQLEETNRMLSALHEVAAAASEALDLDRVLQVAIENRGLYDQLEQHVKQLQSKTTELERANKAKSEFLSVMSHELRTPLNVIMGYARVVKEGMLGAVNPEQEKALQKAIDNSSELLRMVGGILEATSIEAGAVTVESYAISPADFLDGLRSNYDAPLEKELTLRWDYPAGLPPMQTDCDKLKHILQNLINNAIKFTDKGRVTVSARHMPEAAAIEFKVSDTGIGIPEESLPVIFEMFRQVDSSASRPFGGVGLGLFIVKKLTELLGGKVEVESKVGEGSTFTVTIPMALSLPRLL